MKPAVYFSCQRKVCYESEKAANKAAKRQTIKQGRPFRSYKCHFCYGYHITHTPEGTGIKF